MFSICTYKSNHSIHSGIPPRIKSCSITLLTIWTTFVRKNIKSNQTTLAIDVGKKDT